MTPPGTREPGPAGQGHGHGHLHGHLHGVTATGRHRGALTAVLALTTLIAIAVLRDAPCQ